MATAVLANDRGLTVLSTTRRPERADRLREIGVEHPIVDNGEVAATGVRLTAYGGDAADLPTSVLQRFLDDVATGKLTVPVHKVYKGLEQVPEAHGDMEHGNAIGKLVVLP
jgi:zinc-binding alcohol dehydrogenase family protein